GRCRRAWAARQRFRTRPLRVAHLVRRPLVARRRGPVGGGSPAAVARSRGRRRRVGSGLVPGPWPVAAASEAGPGNPVPLRPLTDEWPDARGGDGPVDAGSAGSAAPGSGRRGGRLAAPELAGAD